MDKLIDGNTRTHENRLYDLPVIQEELAASQERDKHIALLGSYSASKFSVIRSMDRNAMAKFGMAVHFMGVRREVLRGVHKIQLGVWGAL